MPPRGGARETERLTAEEKEEVMVVMVVVVVVEVVVQSEGRGGNDGNAVTQGVQGKRRGGARWRGKGETSEREKGRKEEGEREAYVCGRGKVREKERRKN